MRWSVDDARECPVTDAGRPKLVQRVRHRAASPCASAASIELVQSLTSCLYSQYTKPIALPVPASER